MNTILIADDEANPRALVRTALEDSGCLHALLERVVSSRNSFAEFGIERDPLTVERRALGVNAHKSTSVSPTTMEKG